MQPSAHAESERLLSILFESLAEGPSDLLDLSDFPFAAWPLAFIAEKEYFGHSLAVCPTPPQKRQRLLVNQQAHSAAVSLLSLPSLSPKSDFFYQGCE